MAKEVKNEPKASNKNPPADTKGISAKKSEDFSEWFTQLIVKTEFADYTKVSGCIVFRPMVWSIWEKIMALVNERIKRLGVQNVSFPLFIPESLLTREQQHLEGFTPEVAWVTHAGDTQLNERLAVRPTSEAIMYDSYSKWIRSYRDLPLKYNQWSNVVRWEFKHPTPLLRTREFFFNEGHTVFATKEEAVAEQDQIIGMYKDVCENYLALPSLIGKKSDKEKFAGAEFTTSMEFLMPNGKGIQGPDFHHDGQNFSKAYDITFLDQKGQKQFAWQNTWAISTRMLGVLLAIHSDDKGLVLPPKVAPLQAVIVPILFEDSKAKVLAKAREITKKLEEKGISVTLDDRESYTPGWKFNEWELKGIPVRIELGPKDLDKNQVMVARRDTGEKKPVPIASLASELDHLLDAIQHNLLDKAKKHLESAVVEAASISDAKKKIDSGKIVFVPWCGTAECEDNIKAETGAKSLNSPLEQPKLKKGQTCFACEKVAKEWFRFGRSY